MAMPRLDDQLCFALYSASRTMTRAYRDVLEPLGLTYPQYLVMLALWERDGLSLKELGEQLLLDSGTLTPLLKRLESDGLLSRRRAPQDERRMVISLTDKGIQLGERAPEVPKAILAHIGESISLEELLTLRAHLNQLTRELLTRSEPQGEPA